MAEAVVDFRTVGRGAYKWIKRGQNRGYWRVLLVQDPLGSYRRNSRNVLEVLWIGPEGIDGVTSRSRYDISDSCEEATRIAEQFNLENNHAK
jgi:hypothetical protein